MGDLALEGLMHPLERGASSEVWGWVAGRFEKPLSGQVHTRHHRWIAQAKNIQDIGIHPRAIGLTGRKQWSYTIGRKSDMEA